VRPSQHLLARSVDDCDLSDHHIVRCTTGALDAQLVTTVVQRSGRHGPVGHHVCFVDRQPCDLAAVHLQSPGLLQIAVAYAKRPVSRVVACGKRQRQLVAFGPRRECGPLALRTRAQVVHAMGDDEIRGG
jgi:hypothetical protein